eukprot:730086-Hanusia_phi.AAC.1
MISSDSLIESAAELVPVPVTAWRRAVPRLHLAESIIRSFLPSLAGRNEQRYTLGSGLKGEGRGSCQPAI